MQIFPMDQIIINVNGRRIFHWSKVLSSKPLFYKISEAGHTTDIGKEMTEYVIHYNVANTKFWQSWSRRQKQSRWQHCLVSKNKLNLCFVLQSNGNVPWSSKMNTGSSLHRGPKSDERLEAGNAAVIR